jgi:hypothetical protein
MVFMGQVEVVKCKRCGEWATVRSVTPVFDRVERPQSGPTAAKASVVLECPKCGVRTQIVERDVN